MTHDSTSLPGDNHPRRVIVAAAGLLLACWVQGAFAAVGSPLPPPETGVASIYSDNLGGRITASGERYDGNALTAAHRTLPLGAEVKVTRINNGRSVRVKINDRGPNVAARSIDLSSRAARELGMHSGVARVRIEVLSVPAEPRGR